MENKKRYFVISSIVQIIVSFFSILFLNKYVSYIVESYKKLSINDTSFETNIFLMEKYGHCITLVLAVITIILNIFILYNIIKKSDKIAWYLILITAIVCFFTTESSIIGLLSLINFIVVCTKRNYDTKPKSVNNEDLPTLSFEKVYTHEKIVAVIILIVYFFLPDLISLLPWGVIIKSVILDIILIIVCLGVFFKELQNGTKVLIKSFKKYFNFIFNKQILAFGVYFLISAIVVIIKNGQSTSVNQQLAESLPLLYILPSALIYAPFVEELVFRCALRKLIKNDYLFIAISGIIFGIIHTLYEETFFDLILLSLPYAVLGSFFAYLYVKTNNITTSMIGHFLHNAFASLMMLIA
ncbi:MAG: CPBP family intramembrane metalloprotease [Firmicutes bacterium]|nr:CPBP family intramembrane metalloprotease [Bacillota bacterium]